MNPILFQTDYFVVNTFWVFITAAIIIGTIALIRLTVRHGLKVQFLSDHSGILLLWTIVGARIFGLIENYDNYLQAITNDTFLTVFFIWDKGLNLWGGLLAFLLCLYFLCKKQDHNFWKWLDVIIPAFVIAYGIGSIGAFFEGINYGNETNLPWGVNFESPAIKYTVPIHPTQIYASIYSIIIATGLILIPSIKKIRDLNFPGMIGFGGMFIFSLFRFLEEFVRGDDVWTIFDIRVTQIVAGLTIIFSGIFLYISYNRHTKNSTNSTK